MQRTAAADLAVSYFPDVGVGYALHSVREVGRETGESRLQGAGHGGSEDNRDSRWEGGLNRLALFDALFCENGVEQVEVVLLGFRVLQIMEAFGVSNMVNVNRSSGLWGWGRGNCDGVGIPVVCCVGFRLTFLAAQLQIFCLLVDFFHVCLLCDDEG